MTDMSLSWPYEVTGRGGYYPEEVLGPGDDVPHHDGRAEGVDHVLVVWVEDESADDLA